MILKMPTLVWVSGSELRVTLLGIVCMLWTFSIFLLLLLPGMTKPLQAVDLPSRLLLDSVVCLLRTLVVGMAMHCHTLNTRHTNSVSSLLHCLVKSGAIKGTIVCETVHRRNALQFSIMLYW